MRGGSRVVGGVCVWITKTLPAAWLVRFSPIGGLQTTIGATFLSNELRFLRWKSGGLPLLFTFPLLRALLQAAMLMMVMPSQFFMPHPAHKLNTTNPAYAPHSPQPRPAHRMGVGMETPAPPRQPADQATKPQQDPSSASSSSLSKQHQRPQDDQQDEDMPGHEQQQQQKQEAGETEGQQEEEQQEDEPQQQEREQRHSPSEGHGKEGAQPLPIGPSSCFQGAIQAYFYHSFVLPPDPQLV